MRYIMVAIWSILIGTVISYVLTSMANEPFSMTNSLILAAVFAIFVILLGDGALKEQNEH
ncbi:MAG TPA: YjzD family protein [Candidatus Avamphibacillus sp.]|nr:YjzD family protein [Candidatus Avamphibacillus sp.]